MTGGDFAFLAVGVGWGLAVAYTIWWFVQDVRYAELGEGVEP